MGDTFDDFTDAVVKSLNRRYLLKVFRSMPIGTTPEYRVFPGATVHMKLEYAFRALHRVGYTVFFLWVDEGFLHPKYPKNEWKTNKYTNSSTRGWEPVPRSEIQKLIDAELSSHVEMALHYGDRLMNKAKRRHKNRLRKMEKILVNVPEHSPSWRAPRTPKKGMKNMSTLHKTSILFQTGGDPMLCIDGKCIGYITRLELDDLLHIYEIEVTAIDRMPGVPPVEEDIPALLKPAVKLRPRSEFSVVTVKKDT